MKTADYDPKTAGQTETIDMPAAMPPYSVVEPKAESVGGTIAWTVWERRRSISKKLGIFLATLTVILFLIPNSYESTTTLMPPDSGGNMDFPLALGAIMDKGGSGSGGGSSSGGGGGGSGLSGIAGSLLGLKGQGDIFIGVLQSETIENRLIDRFDLRRVYWTKYYASARDKLQSSTTITSDRKSGIITITVSDHRSDRAQKLAQAYVEELDHTMSRVSTSAARRERVFLEDRLKQVKRDLDTASRRLGDFSSKNAIMDVDDQAKAMMEAEGQLEGQLMADQSELAGLQEIYSDNNVRVKALKAQIAGLNQQIVKFGGTPGNGTDTIPGMQSPTLRALPLVGTVYVDYFRESKIQEKIYEVLTQEYELAKVEEAKEIPPVRVLDPADLAEKKSWPPRGRILLIAALLGVFFAIGWVWAEFRWERMDDNHPRKVTLLELRDLAVTIWTWTLNQLWSFWRWLRRDSAPQ
jgi:capsule polysaccharide export protein KpsE/RkpR